MGKKQILYILLGIGIVIVINVFLVCRILFGVSIKTANARKVLYIPTGSSYEQVLDTLYKNLDIKNRKLLEWVAVKKNYPVRIKPGRYIIDSDMSYTGLINMLRSGRQKPVKITFNNVRTLNQLAGKIGKQIEADSSRLINFLLDDANYNSDGFNKENIIDIFIPDTYELYWNTDARGLYTRMLKEYYSFWDEERLSKAKAKGLNPKEVAILASIIDDEVVKPDEKPRIAGVYLNRLKRGMPLQACPTIKFALNDFTITRVLNKYLTVNSPYNTYIHNGFPPGPIGCPSIQGIDAVLNAQEHEFIFFAAKADFSGYHNFSRTLSEHNRYAAMYQKELDRRRIFK
jgi:UPF0755 protein